MKTIVYSDFAAAKTLLLSQVFIGLFVAAIIAFTMGSVYAVFPVIPFTFSISLVIFFASLDESNNWQGYRLCLPLSRKQIIFSRYVSVLIMSIFSLFLGIIIFLIFVGGLQVFGSSLTLNAELVFQAQNVSWDVMLSIIVGTAFVSLVINAVLLPLAARFGMTQGLSLAPLAFMAIVIVGFFAVDFLTQSNGAVLSAQFIEWISDPVNGIIVSFASIGTGFALYALSYLLSAKLYERREF